MRSTKLSALTDQELLTLKNTIETQEANMGNSDKGRKSIKDMLEARETTEALHNEYNKRLAQIVINNLVEQGDLTEAEIRQVFYVNEPSELINSVNIFHSNRLELDVVGLDGNGKLSVIGTHEFNQPRERIVIDEVSETQFIIDKDNTNIEVIQGIINDTINNTLEAKVIAALNTSQNKVVKTNSIATDITEAIKKLSNRNKNNCVILVSPETYVANSNIIDSLDKLEFMLVPGIEKMYVASLGKIALNYVEDKLMFAKDSKTGKFTFGLSLFNLDSAILDTTAVVIIE